MAYHPNPGARPVRHEHAGAAGRAFPTEDQMMQEIVEDPMRHQIKNSLDQIRRSLQRQLGLEVSDPAPRAYDASAS
jgi:hypothetical protein